jgi:hypothetical protein
MHVAEELGLTSEQRTDLYYAELLKDAGCTTYTSQLAGFWMADELAAKRDLQFFRDSRNPLDIASWLFKYVAVGAALTTRASHILGFLANGRAFMKEGFESTCLVAKRIAQRLGMPHTVPPLKPMNTDPITTHVALLRGVNVGGKNRLPMRDLAFNVRRRRLYCCRHVHSERERRVPGRSIPGRAHPGLDHP